MVPNICASSVCNLVHVSLLGLRVLGWPPNFEKCGRLCYIFVFRRRQVVILSGLCRGCPYSSQERYKNIFKKKANKRKDQLFNMCCVVFCGVVLCCVVLCCVVWCCVVLCCVVWCCVVLCCVMWCGVVLCGVVFYGVVLYGVVLCCVVLCGVAWCCVVWCCVVLCGVVLCCVVLCCVVLLVSKFSLDSNNNNLSLPF